MAVPDNYVATQIAEDLEERLHPFTDEDVTAGFCALMVHRAHSYTPEQVAGQLECMMALTSSYAKVLSILLSVRGIICPTELDSMLEIHTLVRQHSRRR